LDRWHPQEVDDKSYKIRSRTSAKSTWSAVNSRASPSSPAKVDAAGWRRAFARRRREQLGTISFENRAAAKLSDADEREFRRDLVAWNSSSANRGYRRLAAWW